MKYIFLRNNIVQEIIPEFDPVFPEVPPAKRYSAKFIAELVPIDDDVRVEQKWMYDPETGTFSPPEDAEFDATDPVEGPTPTLGQRLQEAVDTLQANMAPAIAAVRAYAMTATDVPDASALDMASLFPTWEEVLEEGKELPQGRVISKDEQLYRVVQTVQPQAHQVPGGEGMLAIYRPIDKAHTGTLEDPIPWVYGMDCLAGLYYSYNGAIYRVAAGGNMIPCVWPPDTPGLWQWEKIEEVN